MIPLPTRLRLQARAVIAISFCVAGMGAIYSLAPQATGSLAAATAGNEPCHGAVNPAAGGWCDDGYTRRVFDLVNSERSRVGLGPLAVEPRLAASAAAYAKVLAEGAPFAHVGPDGSTPVMRAEAAGFPFTVPEGEVLAWGNQGWTPEGVVHAWLDSPPHREEILSSIYTRAGIGCHFIPANDVTVYCDMELAGR